MYPIWLLGIQKGRIVCIDIRIQIKTSDDDGAILSSVYCPIRGPEQIQQQ